MLHEMQTRKIASMRAATHRDAGGISTDRSTELNTTTYHDEMLTEILRNEHEEDVSRLGALRESQLGTAAFNEDCAGPDELQDEWYDCHDYLDDMYTSILKDACLEDDERLDALQAEDGVDELHDTWIKFDELQDERYDHHDYLDDMHTSILRDIYLEDEMRLEALQAGHDVDGYEQEAMRLDSLRDEEHDFEDHETEYPQESSNEDEIFDHDIDMHYDQTVNEYTDDDEFTDDERHPDHYDFVDNVDFKVYHEPPEFDSKLGEWMQPTQTFSEEVVRQWKSISDSKPSQCGMCRVLYRDNLLLRSKHGRGLTFTRQISPLKSRNSDCGLCRFLSNMLIATSAPGTASDGTGVFTLKIIRPSMYNYSRQTGRTTLLLVTDDYGATLALASLHFKAVHRQWLPPTTNPESIDFESLRRMATRCFYDHEISCRKSHDEQLPTLKVIDCTSGEVVPAPKPCQYVALSYVWGDGYNQPKRDSVAYCYPQTIIDSIRVTMEMGYRYLWVDKYCIDQKNKSEKHDSIQNMHRIYSNAKLTIIAAAGADPSYGLPGVGPRHRAVKHQLDLNRCRLSQLMRPGLDFPKSSWWGRGWTYQEGVLSRRKLIFTDHRVFFVCNDMHAVESLDIVDSDLVSTDDEIFNELRLPAGSRSYETYLEDYSRRALTHQSDVLSACLGILKATSTRHAWGVPIVEDITDPRLALGWRHNGISTRREGFPSWSWTGWKGGSTFQSAVSRLPLSISLSDNGTRSWTLQDYLRSGHAERYAGSSEAPRILNLTGFVLDASWLRNHWPTDLSDFCISISDQQMDTMKPNVVLDFDGLSALATLYLDQEMTTEQLHDVIAIGVTTTGKVPCTIALLLKPDGAYYNRIGLIELQCHGSVCPQQDGSHAFWNQRAKRQTVMVQ